MGFDNLRNYFSDQLSDDDKQSLAGMVDTPYDPAAKMQITPDQVDQLINGDPEKVAATGEWLAEKASDSPYLQTAVKTSYQMAPMLLGLAHGAVAGAPEMAPKEFVSPLEGLPKSSPGPSKSIVGAANEYMTDNNMPLRHPKAYVPVDENRARVIADAFESAKHDPNDPQVKAAYDALIRETQAQYQKLKELGIQPEKIQQGQANPYADSRAMMDDVNKNKHLWYYPTDQGFGTVNEINNHPLLQHTSEELNGEKLRANDLFRIVHDVFGHAKEGVGFGPRGEENAWRSHLPMFSPEAQRALTTETRGQNSWVNYGPHGEANRANPANTTYADQKAALLPEWVNEPASKPMDDKFQRLLKRFVSGQ